MADTCFCCVGGGDMQQDAVATHTSHAVLSAAAFMDFQAEVHRLQANGDVRGAVRLWTSAVEVVHKPWPRVPVVRPPGVAVDEAQSACPAWYLPN